MFVKQYERGNFKVYMGMFTRDLYAIIYLNGNNSQIIDNKYMDYDTATEMFDYIVSIDLGQNQLQIESPELPIPIVEEVGLTKKLLNKLLGGK